MMYLFLSHRIIVLSLLLLPSGSMLEAWQAYIAWEIKMGKINEARSLYKRSYSKRFPGTGSEVTPRLQELQLFRLQQESQNIGPVTNERENSSKKSVREKRKPTSNSTDEQAPSNRRKNIAQNLNTTIKNEKDQARQSTEASETAKLSENKAEHASSRKIKDNSSKISGQFDDQCTAFIYNLSLQATADDLHNFFADVGGVVAIRILKDKFTKSRGWMMHTLLLQ